MTLRQKYQLAVDLLAYMIAWSPHFPKYRGQTFAEALDELHEYLRDLEISDKRSVSLEGIAKVREAVANAKERFDARDEDGGRFQIQYAHRYLEFAQKGKQAPDPLF